MANIPEYVLVDHSGSPQGFSDPYEAVAKFATAPWHLRGVPQGCDTVASAVAKLVTEGKLIYDEHMPDCSPILRALYANPHGRPIEMFTNAHLWHRQLSAKYLTQTFLAWEARNDGPRVGDCIEHFDHYKPDVVKFTRFTYDWGDSIQVGGSVFGGGFHLGQHGYASFSGGLDPDIPKARIVDTGRRCWASFWFFIDGCVGAHRGVSFLMPVRCYKELPK